MVSQQPHCQKLKRFIKKSIISILLRETEIAKLNQSIKKSRIELKKFSDNVTKIIEKKLIFSNPYQTVQTRPNFHPEFHSPKLNELMKEREELHAKISELKA